ncbi:helix-turn-helix domain-containing protein [Nakamurella sp. GG22]
MAFQRKEDTPDSVVGRFLLIINVFESAQAALTLSEISRRTELPTTTTLRLLTQLTHGGVLVRGDDRRFWIGPQLVQLVDRLSPPPRLAATS